MTEDLHRIIAQMEPDTALSVLVNAIKGLLPQLDEQARLDMLLKLLGETGSDKVASLVDL
ncbi:MAG: hypothetical protein SCH71_10430 [Desulfobulbaceae bacterium]|nr:hypothetical protein [Desulfobulbaceae bacterium]